MDSILHPVSEAITAWGQKRRTRIEQMSSAYPPIAARLTVLRRIASGE